MKIVIDGESGTGKSTVAKLVSEIVGFLCVHTGDIYRQIAYMALKQGIDYTNVDGINNLLNYSIKDNCLQLSGYNNEDVIHGEECARIATLMAGEKDVKTAINNGIKHCINEKDAVVEGRNVSINMLPEATVKVMLFADIETRTERRIKQLENDSDYNCVKESLQFRDMIIPGGKGNYDVSINTSIYDIGDTVSMILRAYYRKTHKRSLIELKHFIYSSCQRDTAYKSSVNQWSPDNPTRGHCAIASMLVYECFGGIIQKGYIEKYGEWHYWNVVNDAVFDLTKESYKGEEISIKNIQNVSFEALMANSDTQYRFELLKERTINREKRFWEINDLILNCKKCLNIHTPAFQTVSFGKKCEILVIGEAPAKNGWRITGKAWINEKGDLVPTGKNLKKLLNEIELDIDDISYMEAIKCYPDSGRVTKEQIMNCKSFFYTQINNMKPQLILSMGKHATEYLLVTEKKFSDMVGNIYSITILDDVYKVIPIYHTSPASPLSYKGNVPIFERIKTLISL